MKLKGTIIFFLALGVIAFTGCRNSDRDKDTDVKIARSYALSEQYFNDPFFWVFKLMINPNLTQNNLIYLDSVENCITNSIGIKKTGNITEVTILFNSTQSCNDNRVRKGEVKAKIWGDFKQENSTAKITTRYFFINDIQVDITDSLHNLGRDSDSNLVFSSRVRNGILQSDTLYVEWDANHTWTWSIGESNRQYSNDELTGIGLVKSLSYTGNTYTAEIIEPLKMDLGCYWITEGVVNMQPENILPRDLNFGSNAFCNNEVDVRIMQRNYVVTID